MEEVESPQEEVVDNGHGIKPFLKWAGGKSRLIDTLKKKFPINGTRYIEMFLGAGSVALNVKYPEYIVNDCNNDLMTVWGLVKDNSVDFINESKKLFISKNNTEDTFYEFRNEFNTTKDKFRKATLFIYLNRHCFNGLCRYNASGEFNVPFGKYTKPYFPEKELNNCLDIVQKFQIHNKDFREIFQLVRAGDVVYCDPPYMPLSASANLLNVTTFDFLEEETLIESVKRDYDLIRYKVKECGFKSLTSHDGEYIQARTKGAGHGSVSRAFYARKKFLEMICPPFKSILTPTTQILTTTVGV